MSNFFEKKKLTKFFRKKIQFPIKTFYSRIRSDHNEDETGEVLNQWLYKWSKAYHHVDIEYDNTTKRRASETSQTHWSDERYLEVIRMKEEALNYGRKIWADYIFVSCNILSLIFIRLEMIDD